MRNIIVWSMFCIIFTTALLSCSSGSTSNSESAPNTMTVTVADITGTITSTFTQGSLTTSSQGYSYLDPIMTADVLPSNHVYIELRSGMSNTQTVTILGIETENTTAQSYSIAANHPSYISYNSGGQWYATFFSSNPTGTIVLDSVGNVGEKITGSFDAIVTDGTITSAPGNVDTRRVSGTFSVKRGF